MSPTFTQKHYEYLIRAIRADESSSISKQRAVEILCRAFKQDNPKFKRALFVAQCTEIENVVSKN